jgi:iron complex transport system ATP-binding protein
VVVKAGQQTVLEGRGLSFTYDHSQVITDVSLELRAGEFLGIIGPNGSGKSTLLGILSGLLTPRVGQVLLLGKKIRSFPRHQLAQIMGLLPQAPQLAHNFTALETVLSGRYARMGRQLFAGAEDEKAAWAALEQTGLRPFASRPAGELSGGERQRLALARALACDPRILLLDEPTSALDLDHQLKVMGLLERSCRDQGKSVCLVSHDLNLAGLFCGRLVLLSKGSILAQGSAAEVMQPELLLKAYGVKTLVDEEPSRGRPRVSLVPE